MPGGLHLGPRTWLDDIAAPSATASKPARAGLRQALAGFGVDGTASAQEIGQRGAMLYAAGSVLGLVSLVAQHPPRVVPVILIAVAVTTAIAVALWFAASRIPTALFPVFTAVGTALITIVIRELGSFGDAYAVFYVWVALYAFYFYTTRMAVVQVALIAAGYASVMSSLVEYVTVVGTVCVVGVWTQAAVRRVRTLARTDALTGIPNRRAWDEQLTRAIAQARRQRHHLCVAILDIDHFKLFNDEQGHQAGDKVLETLAGAWTAGLREGDILARYGGEEFSILLPACTSADAVATVERLRARMPRGLTCSAGVALWDRLEQPMVLMGRSDAALYEAKATGRNRIIVAPQQAEATDADRLAQSSSSIGTVLDILEKREVGIVFQPIVRLDPGGGVVGFEALARPLGYAPHSSVEAVFVAAQRMGLVRELDHICRRSAVDAARRLPVDALLFLNMSVATLIDPEHGPDQLLMLLDAAGRTPDRVVLEVSERETITDLDQAASALRAYRDAGFRFALDDVGEGHATLRVLAMAVPEYVKIAASFVRQLALPGPHAAVAATCLFAQQTGAALIAEGIEDAMTAAQLRAMGVGLGQGEHIARPDRLPMPPQVDIVGTTTPRAALG